MLHYSDLTEVQKQSICNGCGVKGGLIKPPDFIFKASCNQHDFYYWRGYSEEDRKKADKAFYKFMRVDITSAKWLMKPYYHLWAFGYYTAVRLFGKKFFNYSKNMRASRDIKG